MKKLDTKSIGIDQGEAVIFSEYEGGGTMWTGAGERTRRHPVSFSGRYRALPVVHCALSMWDIDSGANARVEVSAESVTNTGFDIVFRTWGDTRIARARVGWMAIGEVLHEDDWDLY
ncbi:MAG TPA: H-type lectin domain-containing protein [Roseovarius sp.]